MTSKAIYARDWGTEIANGLQPETFHTLLLCEGDSWMDRSSMTQLSLPWALEDSFNASGDDVLLVNLSHFGDTLVHIGEHVNTEFRAWLDTSWRYAAILVSAGGNDFIDAALQPPRRGLLRAYEDGMTAHDCVDGEALALLRDTYLKPHFRTLVDTVRASPQGPVPIYLNSYFAPTARDAPARPGGKAWLSRAYTSHGIPDSMWKDLSTVVFGEVASVVEGWAASFPGVVRVPTTLAGLTPAQPGSTGSSGDWANEIHPNKSGWRKLARVWRESIGL
jgi:hypothetical protein